MQTTSQTQYFFFMMGTIHELKTRGETTFTLSSTFAYLDLDLMTTGTLQALRVAYLPC